jgi:site-specific recombinase XerD
MTTGLQTLQSRQFLAGKAGSHLTEETNLQRAVKEAMRKAQVFKHVDRHTLRHTFANHLSKGGFDIRIFQELLGHNDVKTTMIYTHLLNRAPGGVHSPVDSL